MKPKEEPTGNCFQAAGDLFIDLWMKGEHHDWRLVHAKVSGTGPLHGYRFTHAFLINKAKHVIVDVSNGKEYCETPADIYIAIGNILPRRLHKKVYREWTLEEARSMMLEHGHYGPWACDQYSLADYDDIDADGNVLPDSASRKAAMA